MPKFCINFSGKQEKFPGRQAGLRAALANYKGNNKIAATQQITLANNKHGFAFCANVENL
jgi:hypothetical protein